MFVSAGLAYDEVMLRHACVCRNDANHPENPSRLLCVWSRLTENGLHNKCEVVSYESCHLLVVLWFGLVGSWADRLHYLHLFDVFFRYANSSSSSRQHSDIADCLEDTWEDY